MHALILAAGFGTRFRPYTDKLAKPAIPFLDIPILFFNIPLIETLGVENLVINTHHLPDTITELFRNKNIAQKSKVLFSHESPHILGTGGALSWARKSLETSDGIFNLNSEPVVFLNPPTKLNSIKEGHLQSKALATLVLTPVAGAGEAFPGVWIDTQGFVREFGKGPKAGLRCYHFTGLRLFSNRIFDYVANVESNILYDNLTKAMQSGEVVRAEIIEAKDLVCLELGNLDEYFMATRLAIEYLNSEEGFVHEQLKALLIRFGWDWPLVAPMLKQTNWLIHPTSKIEKNVVLEGYGVIGREVHVQESVRLKNSVLGPRAIIASGTKLQEQLILSDQ